MGAAAVAGSVRAKALAHRRLGRAGARRLASVPTTRAAVEQLTTGPYGHEVRREHTLAEAEAAVARTLLWHLRVLAGWQARAGTDAVRLLAGAFELANLDEQINRVDGRPAAPPYHLGSLAVAWPRLAQASSRRELRAALAASAWGDPGADSAWALAVVPRLSWLHRIFLTIPAAAPWAQGAALLLFTRERLVRGQALNAAATDRLTVLIGAACLAATSVPEVHANAGTAARWVLDGIVRPDELWRAEVRWWARVDRDGLALLHGMRFTASVAVGCAAVLAVDAWRVRAALAAASRGGVGTEVFDALD